MQIIGILLTDVALVSVCIYGCAAADEASSAARGARLVTVDFGIRHQVVENFGASDCWAMQKIGAWSDSNRNRVADLLFSQTEGIGLSCWRLNLGGGLDYEHMGPDSWRTVETFEVAEGQYDWTRQAGERWFLGAAKARGVKQFVAFCNSPPARMTRNGRTFCADNQGATNLKEGYEGQFARYLADILTFFCKNPEKSQRINFRWVSPVNEPQWAWVGGDQEGCRASNRDIKNVVLALHKELRRQGLRTNILVPESGDINGMRASAFPAEYDEPRPDYRARGDYLEAFCGDPEVAGKLGHVVSAHSYRTDLVPNLLIPERVKFREKLDQYPGWRYWMTEYCIMQGPENQGGNGRDLTMKTALEAARVIHYDLTICGASAWQWWTAVSAADYKDGLIYTDYHRPGDAETIYPAKLLWVLGNYSRFIRPGARRLECTGADDVHELLGSAYKSPSGAKIVIVFLNMADKAATVSLRLKGLPRKKTVKALVPHVTSGTHDLKAYPPLAADADYIIPERSVVTLVGALVQAS